MFFSGIKEQVPLQCFSARKVGNLSLSKFCIDGTDGEGEKYCIACPQLKKLVLAKNKGIEVKDTDWENAKTFENKEQNYSLEITLTEDSTYANNKEYAKEEEGYEEVKFGKYSG